MNTRLKFAILPLAVLIGLILLAAAPSPNAGILTRPPLAPLMRQQAQDDQPAPAWPLVLTDEQDQYPLGLHLELLEDPGGELTIEDVSSPEFATRFTPSQVGVPNFGFTDSVFWVRFRLDNQTRQMDEWLLEQGFANMQYIDLYTPLPDGKEFAIKQTGTELPLNSRDRIDPNIVFSLPLAPQSQQTFYLRFQNDASMTLPLTLWTPEVFALESQREHMIEGLFFGVLLGLLAYNLFLFLSLRETSYLYLLFCLAAIILFDVTYSGYLETYILPSLYAFKSIYLPLAFALIFVSILSFTDVFLQLKQHAPRFHRIVIVFLLVWGLLILLVPVISYLNMARLMTIWAVSTLLMALLAGVSAWQQGFLPSRYHVFAWFGLAVGVTVTILIRQGLVPSTFFSESLYRVGFMWMAVSLSLALADRINTLKAETEHTNLELRSSEHRLAQILEGLPLGVVVYGPDQKPNFVNQRTAEILDYPARGIQADPAAGRTLAQAIDYFSFKIAGSDQDYPLDNFPVYQALQGTLAGADDIEADRGDQRLPLEIWASPVWDEAGNVQAAVVAFQDITQRKQAEMALRISETRFRVVAENNFDGIAFLARDREVLYVSPSYLRLVGKTAEEMIGQSGVGLVHPDDREYTAKMFTEVLQQPGTRVTAEYRIPHKDGSWIWVETFAINMLDDPDVQAVVLNSHDISERKQAEAELAEYNQHLESLIEDKTAELSAANEQLQRRLTWLSAINFIDQVMAQSAEFNQIYQQVIEIINNIFNTHGSFIVALDDGGQQSKILAHSCQHKYGQDLVGTFTHLPDGILSRSKLGEEYPFYLSQDQFHTLSGPIGAHLGDIEIQNIALMPLVTRENVYGYLGLEMHEQGMAFTSEAADLLKIFSTDIARLIENERLYEQRKAIIEAEERGRLARDLHDSVTQVLFSGTLVAEVLP
jgi:PAS domain S-box-containing protein